MIADLLSLDAAALGTDRPLVVGSGPVGIVTARRLAELGLNPLVIEAGAIWPSPDRARDLAIVSCSNPLKGAVVGRTRQLGGGLNLWGGQLARFTLREQNGFFSTNGAWPSIGDEIETHLPIALRLAGAEQTCLPPPIELRLPKGLQERGLEPYTTAWLRKPKLSREIWSEIETSSSITVLTEAPVVALDFDRMAGRICGVFCRMPNGERRRISGSPVILACGAIETVRLLWLPAGDGEPCPWINLAWLGRGFHEHLDASTGLVAPIDAAKLHDIFDPSFHRGAKYTTKLAIFDNDKCGLGAVATLTTPGNVRNSIIELGMLAKGLTPRPSAKRRSAIVSALYGSVREVGPLAWRYLRHRRLGTVLRGKGVLRISIEQPTRWESRIRLSKTAVDRFGVPRAALDWRKGAAEGAAFLEASRRIKSWMEATRIATVEIDPALEHDPTAFAEAADEGLHHAGGAIMAETSSEGVVDPDLALFGVTGLYCVGTAVFPRMGIGNPTLTAMALGARLAVHIATKSGMEIAKSESTGSRR